MTYELTQYEKNLYEKWVVKERTTKILDKTTVVALKLKNDFEVIGTAACVDKDDFVLDIGRHFALKDALRKLDELNGFLLQQKNHEEKDYEKDNSIAILDRESSEPQVINIEKIKGLSNQEILETLADSLDALSQFARSESMEKNALLAPFGVINNDLETKIEIQFN